jgi:serine/threonine protein phosphatase PrpC
MQLSSHGITDPGHVRDSNEDAFLIDEAHQVFAIADGLGGLPGGSDASQRIVELLQQTYRDIDAAEERADIGDLILRIHRIVAQEGIEAHPFTGWGSTLTLAQIIGDQLLIGQVGDSAAYHLHHQQLEKITIDQTMEQALIDRLGETAHQIMPAEYPHTLTQCIGQHTEAPRVAQTRRTLSSGDRLLLCSDGLNKVVSFEAIQTRLQLNESPAVISQQLIDSAKAHGGADNITVIVIFIQEAQRTTV